MGEKWEYGSGFEMVLCEGKGYEPPAGRLLPLLTRQQFLAMFNPLD